jgi:hypothetical protein
MKTKYYILEPQVSTSLGAETKLDASKHPPIVNKLHLEIEDCNADDLQENFPCFIVTEHLAAALADAGFSGYSFDTVKITRSSNFKAMFPDKLPQSFVWLKVHGIANRDDFGIGGDYRLVVSSRALEFLKKYSIGGCIVMERGQADR